MHKTNQELVKENMQLRIEVERIKRELKSKPIKLRTRIKAAAMAFIKPRG